MNSNLYSILPKEYKNTLFHLRGIFFTNKKRYSYKTDEFLRIKDVYHYLKSVDSKEFENFLRCRQLMFNSIRLDNTNENLKAFNKNDKVYYKLSAIFCNKLFPEIMPDDLPPL